MKRIPFFAAFFLFVLLVSARAAEAPGAQEQQILTMVKEVRAQQKAIAENEAKMDAKLAAIAETLRMARIYSVRGGGK
jgi:hypothetical protein